MTYYNIKDHKKTRLHSVSRRYNFGKTAGILGVGVILQVSCNTFLLSKVLFCKIMVLDNVQLVTLFIVIEGITKYKESQILTKIQTKSIFVTSKFH